MVQPSDQGKLTAKMPSFLSPLFLVGAAAAAIPLILHLLKREPEARVKFAAVHLLKHGPVEQTERRRLRDLLLLALRVVALVLLSIVFARPFFASAHSQSAAATIVALDTSLSLSAPGQFERAKAFAKDAIRTVPPADAVGVLTFSDDVHVAASLSGDRALATAAIDAATTDAGATRYRAALQAAVNLLDGQRGTVVVVTDLQEGGWDDGDRVTLPESVRVTVVDVGAPPPNLAISSVHIDGDQLKASIRNVGPEPRDVRVAVTTRSGATTGLRSIAESGGEARVEVGAHQSADAVLPRPVGATAIVSIVDRQGIQDDNSRYIVLDHSGHSSVLVVTAGGDLARDAFYLQQALGARGDRAAYQVDGVSAPQLGTWDAARLEQYSAMVLTATRGLDRRGRDLIEAYTNAGGGVLVAAAPDLDGEVVADALGDAKTLVMTDTGDSRPAVDGRALTPVDARHPVFRTFGAQGSSFGLASFRRVAAIRGQDCQVIARFTTGEVAILDCARGEGRAIVVASDLDNRWNDWPLRPTFVPFVHEAVRYLSGSQPRQSEYIVGEQPAGVPRDPGITALPGPQGGPAKWVAVNVDPRESSPARMSPEEFQSAIAHLKDAGIEGEAARVEARQHEDGQHLWQYVLALVMAALMIESLVAARAA